MKFSIVVPVYNTIADLPECLESVRLQTLGDWECICVDDGSTDGSGEMLDRMSAIDSRIRVVHQRNDGVSAARNVGLRLAQGDWAWFVDSDDKIHSQALEVFNAAIQAMPEIDAVTTDYAFRPFSGRLDCHDMIHLFERVEKHESRVLHMFRGGMCHVLFRRNRIGDLKFEKFIMGEDALFNLSFFWKTHCWAMCKEPLYFYRQRVGSACNSAPSFQKVCDYLEVETRYLELMRAHADLWDADGMREFFNYNSTFVFRTFQNMYFSLSMADRRTLFGKWFRLQCLNRSLNVGTPTWIRCAIGILRVIPSACLATTILRLRMLSVRMLLVLKGGQ